MTQQLFYQIHIQNKLSQFVRDICTTFITLAVLLAVRKWGWRDGN